MHAVLRMSVGSREQAWGSNRTKDSDITRLSPDYSKTPRSDVEPVSRVKYKHLFLWTYKEPNKILLISPEKFSVASLKEHVEKHLYLVPDTYTLATLTSGASQPIPLLKSAVDLNKTFIVGLPNRSIRLIIKHKDDGEMYVKLHPLQTIKELKNEIFQSKGYPIHIQEVMYQKTVLQNKNLIIDYKIRDGDELTIHLQSERPFLVYVDTFWNKRYTIETTSSSTAEDLLHKLFRKTLAKSAYREQIAKLKPMYQGLIHLEYDNNVLDNRKCLNYYGIGEKSTIHVNLLSERRGDQHKVVVIRDDQGQSTSIPCAGYDTWYIVALKLHGSSSIPIDIMKLLLHERPVDLQCTVSIVKVENEVINVDLFLLPPPSSLLGKLTIHVTTTTGNVEKVQCGPKETIKDVKRRLESIGLHYAPYYDIFYKNVRLPGNTKLLEYNLAASEHCSMELKMKEFPISISSGSNSFKLMVRKETSVGQLLRKIEDKVGCSPIKYGVLHSGEDLYNYDNLTVGETYLHVNSQLYVETVHCVQAQHLVVNNTEFSLTKSSENLTQQLAEIGVDVKSFFESYKWFLKWRYPSKSKSFHDLNTLRLQSPSRHYDFNHTGNLMRALHTHKCGQERSRNKARSSKQMKVNSTRPSSKAGHSPQTDHSTLPHIKQSSSFPHKYNAFLEKAQYSSLEMLSNPKPALKSYSRSSERLSISPASLSPDSMSRSKKKLSVRFEVPDKHTEKKRERQIAYPWSSSRKIPTYSPHVATAYSPRSNRTLHRHRSSRSGEISNVAIKFQLDI